MMDDTKGWIRLALGESMCRGPVDWHRLPEGGFGMKWGVEGALEFEDSAKGLEEASSTQKEIVSMTGQPCMPYIHGWQGVEEAPDYPGRPRRWW